MLYNDYAPFSNETYGETKPILVAEFIKHLGINKKDTSFDLGSGIGNVVMQVSMDTGCHAVGIEKDPRCHEAALHLLEQCKTIEPDLEEKIQFWCKDLMKDNINFLEATVIYISNWCFSQQLQLELLNQFATLKEGTKTVALKSLFGQRSNQKRARTEPFLRQEPCIKGVVGGFSWTAAPVDCFVYTKIG